jgi:SAM-dependent methyltransferase
MTVFGDYARYYDLLYREKDYARESAYVDALIRQHRPGAASILNLGCGSGKHDGELAALGYAVTGVDVSEEMLDTARLTAKGNDRLSYVHGDVRTVRLNKTFDVVVSLFHVMSYLETNDDLLAAFTTAQSHLAPGGVFIFDCWYGPGVLTDPPAVRVKELSDETISVTRIARPVMHPNENIVDVQYLVFIRQLTGGDVHEIRETHRMRYLFVPEVKHLLACSGLDLRVSEEWLTAAPLGLTSWNALFVSKKSKEGVGC